MRNEKEIMDRIVEIQKLEKREENYIKEMTKNDETDFMDLHMSKANFYQSIRFTLEWVRGRED